MPAAMVCRPAHLDERTDGIRRPESGGDLGDIGRDLGGPTNASSRSARSRVLAPGQLVDRAVGTPRGHASREPLLGSGRGRSAPRYGE